MTSSVRGAVAIVAASAAIVLGAAPAGALPPGCEASIDNSPVENHQTPGTAKEVDAGSRAVIRGVDNGGAGRTKVGIKFDPLPSVTVRDRVETSTDWSGDVDVDDYATYGVGLYKITASSDNCSGFAWIRVTGKSPFTTVAGIVAAVLIVAGLGTAILGIVRARARSGRTVARTLTASGLSGLPLGLGAMVLAQQAGIFPISLATIVAWLVFAISVVGLSSLAFAGIRTTALDED